MGKRRLKPTWKAWTAEKEGWTLVFVRISLGANHFQASQIMSRDFATEVLDLIATVRAHAQGQGWIA